RILDGINLTASLGFLVCFVLCLEVCRRAFHICNERFNLRFGISLFNNIAFLLLNPNLIFLQLLLSIRILLFQKLKILTCAVVSFKWLNDYVPLLITICNLQITLLISDNGHKEPSLGLPHEFLWFLLTIFRECFRVAQDLEYLLIADIFRYP